MTKAVDSETLTTVRTCPVREIFLHRRGGRSGWHSNLSRGRGIVDGATKDCGSDDQTY